jgi:hypothetical protein
MISRWLARRAFNALYRFVSYASLTHAEDEDCIKVLDILRTKMYKDSK